MAVSLAPRVCRRVGRGRSTISRGGCGVLVQVRLGAHSDEQPSGRRAVGSVDARHCQVSAAKITYASSVQTTFKSKKEKLKNSATPVYHSEQVFFIYIFYIYTILSSLAIATTGPWP